MLKVASLVVYCEASQSRCWLAISEIDLDLVSFAKPVPDLSGYGSSPMRSYGVLPHIPRFPLGLQVLSKEVLMFNEQVLLVKMKMKLILAATELGTINFRPTYKKGGACKIIEYCDVNYGGDRDTRPSTTGHVLTLGLGAVSWCSIREGKKQKQITIQPTTAAISWQEKKDLADKEEVALEKEIEDLRKWVQQARKSKSSTSTGIMASVWKFHKENDECSPN
ncbi:hypothetical protein GH714_022650 [Hevea brasiliensis]|uniref:Uncharacterized protein n=1 Tax=Hevea brasiliensis TaxID=3981 RepID=A0A6A6LCP5_HEVBR|nr:hypothetical protein GH714_022650 [Hevea brasiliensis]